MKRVHIAVQEKFLEFIDKLVELEIYPNRSEAIRSALKEFVNKESQFIQNLNSDMIKLKNIHRKYVEFKDEALSKLLRGSEDILTDRHEKRTHSIISSGEFPMKKKT